MKDFICLSLLLVFIGGGFNLIIAAEVESTSWYSRLSDKVQHYLSLIVFFALYIPEAYGLYYVHKYSEEERDLRDRTTYMIEMPDGNSCEGKFYSGKNSPVSVYCVDGRKFVVNGIEVKYKMIDHKRSYGD